MADQAAFLVVLLVERVGEHLDERSVRPGRLLRLQNLQMPAADLVSACRPGEFIEALALRPGEARPVSGSVFS